MNGLLKFSHRSVTRLKGFTLIELLIVVAIIAILAAIAVPNFLEAQTRAKVSRSMADMRSVDTAMQSYIVDNGAEPHVNQPTGPINYGSWWGFVSQQLTTPIAYMSNLPPMIFRDKYVTGFWNAGGGNESTQPYTVIKITRTPSGWQPGKVYTNNGKIKELYGTIPIPEDFHQAVTHAGYVLYTCGPDGVDATVWGTPMIYDPSNGTVSFGDIYRFGAGQPEAPGSVN